MILLSNNIAKYCKFMFLRYCTRHLQAQVLQKKWQGSGEEGKVPMPTLKILVICYLKIVILVTFKINYSIRI